MQILLATRNPAKRHRLAWLLEGLGLDLLTPKEVPGVPDPDEAAGTHRSIAEQKASHWSSRSGHLALASDGGIRVPALGESWNSLMTRRAAGECATDFDRADHLLTLARDLQGTDRAVVRLEAVALARSDDVVASWESEKPLGVLVDRYDRTRISDGFWLPALIFLPERGKTYAELTPSEIDEIDDPWNELKRLVRGYFTHRQLLPTSIIL